MHTFKLLGGTFTPAKGTIYKRGDVFESEKELDKIHTNKFQRMEKVVVEVPVKDDTDEFSGMTVAELKKFAEGEEIELGSATRKESILKVIRDATKEGW